ncbi:hypothetical protein [Cupriavidus oxalaticus]|uniref:Uncharacterized protein n=1 Tax=Cupriavidus oxalaticus TaxID=96344 RepID=A0A5P3VLA0_9BURK|nr:hypothetical protein [Cupriavidus oxalaticus]QEZ47204.1 hypothetical protein D2917_23940 [Cupriavidus oxalaticus]
MNDRLTPGGAYRMPSGRRAFFARFIQSQKAYQFVYEDDGTEFRHRVFHLSEKNLRLAVPEVGP